MGNIADETKYQTIKILFLALEMILNLSCIYILSHPCPGEGMSVCTVVKYVAQFIGQLHVVL